MKKIIAGTISAAVVFGLTACSPEPKDVNTGSKNSVEAQNASTTSTDASIAATTDTQQTQPEKSFEPNFSKSFKYVKVNVSQIVIKPDQVEVGLNYEVTSKQKITWYPDQGKIVVGDMQLDVDPTIETSLVTGDILPGTKSDGVLVFKPHGDKTIDIDKVDKIKFNLSDIIPEDLGDDKHIDFEIPVK